VLVPEEPKYTKVFDDTKVPFALAPATVDGNTSSSKKEEVFDSEAAAILEEADLATDPDTNETEGEDAAQGPSKKADRNLAKVLEKMKVLVFALTAALEMREADIDTFTKFGLNLYFAGCCSRIGRMFNLNALQSRELLSQLMELTGAQKDDAAHFLKNINDYGERTAYRKMIDADADCFQTSRR
jgi:hypothetical protein